jgi:hypothetical protein
MKTATVREFRDQATKLLKEPEPIMVTRRGKIVGFFLPASGESIPLEIKKDLFHTITQAIRTLMKTLASKKKPSLPISKKPEKLVIGKVGSMSPTTSVHL